MSMALPRKRRLDFGDWILIASAIVSFAVIASIARSEANADEIPRFRVESPEQLKLPDLPQKKEPDVSGQAKYSVDARPVVIVYSVDRKLCIPCGEAEDFIESNRDLLPFRFEFRKVGTFEELPAWVAARGVPLFHFQDAAGKWFAYTDRTKLEENYRRHNPGFALVSHRQGPSPKPLGASPLEQIQKFAGESGRFEFVPDSPIRATMDDGTTVSYQSIRGKYQIVNGVPSVVLDAPLPQVGVKRFGLRFGAVISGADYSPEPPPAGSVGVETNRGRYVLKLEAAQ